MAMPPARMITSEETLARIGRRMNVSATTASALRRLNRRAVGQLLRTGRDDAVAGLDAVEYDVVLTDDGTDFDRALLRGQPAARLLGDEREELAVDPQHGRHGYDETLACFPDDARADVLQRAESFVRVAYLALHEDRLGLIVHVRRNEIHGR